MTSTSYNSAELSAYMDGARAAGASDANVAELVQKLLSDPSMEMSSAVRKWAKRRVDELRERGGGVVADGATA